MCKVALGSVEEPLHLFVLVGHGVLRVLGLLYQRVEPVDVVVQGSGQVAAASRPLAAAAVGGDRRRGRLLVLGGDVRCVSRAVADLDLEQVGERAAGRLKPTR